MVNGPQLIGNEILYSWHHCIALVMGSHTAYFKFSPTDMHKGGLKHHLHFLISLKWKINIILF